MLYLKNSEFFLFLIIKQTINIPDEMRKSSAVPLDIAVEYDIPVREHPAEIVSVNRLHLMPCVENIAFCLFIFLFRIWDTKVSVIILFRTDIWGNPELRRNGGCAVRIWYRFIDPGFPAPREDHGVIELIGMGFFKRRKITKWPCIFQHCSDAFRRHTLFLQCTYAFCHTFFQPFQ